MQGLIDTTKDEAPKEYYKVQCSKEKFQILRKMSSLKHLVACKLGKMTSQESKAMFSFKEKFFKITLFEVLKANLKFQKGSSC
jgi:hypothetical protein